MAKTMQTSRRLSPEEKEEIYKNVSALKHSNADGKLAAAQALSLLKLGGSSRSYEYAVALSGAIEPLVALLRDSEAGGKKAAVMALSNLVDDFGDAIVDADPLEPLVALLRDGDNEDQTVVVGMLHYLYGMWRTRKDCDWSSDRYRLKDDRVLSAIIAAGALETLEHLVCTSSFRQTCDSTQLLLSLRLPTHLLRLQSENASLKRRLGEEDVVDLRDGDAPPPAKKRNALRDAHDEQHTATVKRVKQEKVDAVEDLEDAQELTGHLVQSENNRMTEIDELRGTVSERDARIEALEATIAELRERVGQLERPAPRGGGQAKRSRT